MGIFAASLQLKVDETYVANERHIDVPKLSLYKYKLIAHTWISYCSRCVDQNQEYSPIRKNKKQARLQINGARSKTHHCTLHQPTTPALSHNTKQLNSKNGNLRLLLLSCIVHNYRKSINELIVIWSIAMCAESSKRRIACWPKLLRLIYLSVYSFFHGIRSRTGASGIGS